MIISNLKVLKSAAGYYIGRTCNEGAFDEPFTRESGYYPTREEAEADFNTFEVRICAENEYAYNTGIIDRPHRP